MSTLPRLGILATGSELVMGEILNTNGQQMAQTLLTLGVEIGEHLVVDDTLDNLRAGLAFLLSRHQVVITIGGLGPTTDDCTRQVVTEAIGKPLLFQEASWQRIVERLSVRKLPIPENNRQQAYFPEGSTVLINANGSADGCVARHNEQWIIMLPGPPRECLPMFHNDVIPLLQQHGFTSNKRLYRWRLMGVSESAMAEPLERFAAPYQLQLGYRAHYPFLDIKLHLHDSPELPAILAGVTELVSPHLVTTENSNLSTQLQQKLLQFNDMLTIYDTATKGALAAELSTPLIHDKLHVVHSRELLPERYAIELSGLEQYWTPVPGQHQITLHCSLHHQGERHDSSQVIFLRGQETLQYAIEFACWQMLKHWFKPT